MVKSIYNTIQALTDVSIQRENGTILVLPTASGAVLNPGIAMQDIMSTSRVGEKVIVDRYAIERKPELQLDFNQKSIQLLGVRLGQSWQSVVSKTGFLFNSGLRVTQSIYPAVTVGVEGSGMIADQAASTASFLNEFQVSEVLTRQPFATFDPATSKSFAQGADGAMKFSTDLIGKYVGFDFPYPLANVLALSDLPDTNYKMKALTMMTDRSLIQWVFPSVTVKLDSGDINLNEPAMQLSFQIQDDGSTCVPYEVTYKGQAQKRRCLAD